MTHDVLTIESDRRDGAPLIKQVMERGRLVSPSPSLEDIRQYAGSQVDSLPEHLRDFESTSAYSVDISPALQKLAMEVDQRR